MVALRAGCGEPAEQPCWAEWARLAAQRLGCCDQQVAQLAEARTFRVHGPVTGGHQRPERLPFAAAARRCRTFLFEHAARGPDRVERIGLSARAALPAQAADLEHLLAVIGEEAGQAGAIGAGALDRERPPPRRMPFAIEGTGSYGAG